MNIRYLLFIFTVLLLFSCGSSEQTYGEQKEHEREVVSSFINRNVVMMVGTDTLLDLGKIKVITEEEFDKQDSTTNVEENEFPHRADKKLPRRGRGSLSQHIHHAIQGDGNQQYRFHQDQQQLAREGSCLFATPGGGLLRGFTSLQSQFLQIPIIRTSIPKKCIFVKNQVKLFRISPTIDIRWSVWYTFPGR